MAHAMSSLQASVRCKLGRCLKAAACFGIAIADQRWLSDVVVAAIASESPMWISMFVVMGIFNCDEMEIAFARLDAWSTTFLRNCDNRVVSLGHG
jgi:hypothetical protein